MAKKIIWAFDPYSKNKEVWPKTIDFLKVLKVQEWSEVTPSFLLGHDLVHWISNVTSSQLGALRPIAQSVLDEQVESLECLFLKSPEVVMSKGTSAREDVAVFANYLKSENADIVVLNTHARAGIERFFMGSFTENLILQAKIPALVLPPNVSFKSTYDKVMFPVSFTSAEFEFFKKFLDSPLKTDVVLYSKVFHPVDAFAQSASYALGGGWVSLEVFAQDVISQRKDVSVKWESYARELGVNIETVIDDRPGDLAEWIVKVASERHVDMIAMPSFATSTEAVLLGSNSREVIRHSQVPVYVQHMKV